MIGVFCAPVPVPRRFGSILCLLVVTAFARGAGCGGDDEGGGDNTARTTTAGGGEGGESGCERASSPEPREVRKRLLEQL